MDADTPAMMTDGMWRRMDVAIIVLAVAAAISTTMQPGSALRALLVFAAFLLVPGWGLVSLLGTASLADALGLAIGLSIAVDVLGSLVLVWTGHFDVLVLGAIVAAVSISLLIADLICRSHPRRGESSASQAAG